VRALIDYHHFRDGAIAPDDRVALCEQQVVRLLLASPLTEEQRDSSVVFELKHHHSTAQFARVLARQRGLPLDACTVGALLHDVYVIREGRYADHAHLGAPIALRVMDEIGGFSDDERSIVDRIVFHHSDKHLRSQDPFVEFGKDADVLDCFLYPGAFGFYLRHKRLAVFAHYLERAKNVWREVGMPEEARFSILDTFGDGWMDVRSECGAERVPSAIANLLHCSGPKPPPPLLVAASEIGSAVIAVNRESWELHLEEHAEFAESAPVTVDQVIDADVERHGGDRSDQDADIVLRVARSSGAPVIVWPALDAYEMLDDEARIAELGLDPEELLPRAGQRGSTSDGGDQ
jgi:hypothetical protein